MIILNRNIFLKSLRILYQNEDVLDLIKKVRYEYITVISHEELGLERFGFYKSKKEVVNIYLNGKSEEFLERFNRTTRNEISKTRKIQGLEIKIEDRDFLSAYNLYSEFERSQGRAPWDRDTFNETKLFSAYLNGELIVSIPIYDLFPYIELRSISSKRLASDISKKEYRVVGCATRRLIYEICKYGRGRGYSFVSLNAINFSTPQKIGVSKFKLSFGGKIEDEYTYIYKTTLFTFLEKFIKIKLFIKGLINL